MSLYDEMEVAAGQASEPAPSMTAVTETGVSGSSEQRHRRIQQLAEGFSIEVLPKSAKKITHFAGKLPQGTRVFIPFLPGAAFKDCVPLAIRLRREGMEPVPHIAARRLRSHAELMETLEQLRSEAAITQCLVIAGDPPASAGPFSDSLSLLETGALEASGIETIFVGGQPEGIPGIQPGQVEEALLRKNEYARTSSASIRLITQFTLDIHALASWRKRLHELNISLPVHIGIAGPTTLTTLLKFAALTGATASIRAMRRYGAKLTQLASEAEPDALVSYLANPPGAYGPDTNPGRTAGTGISSLHVYTFGGFEQSAAWMKSLREGAFTLKPNGRGFTIRDIQAAIHRKVL